MNWLKDLYVDVIVLILIIVFGIFSYEVLEVVLWVYTGLLLVGKVLTLFMPSLQRRADTDIPDYVYHIIYGIIIAILIYVGTYYLAGAWGLVWILSIISSSSGTKKK